MVKKTLDFFTQRLPKEKRRIFIQGIRDYEQNWVDEIEDIAGVATDYFEAIFTSGGCD